MTPGKIKRVMELVERYGDTQRSIEDMDHRCEYDDYDEILKSAETFLDEIRAALTAESEGDE